MMFCFFVGFVMFFVGVGLSVFYMFFSNLPLVKWVNCHETWNPIFYFVLGTVFLFIWFFLDFQRKKVKSDICVWFVKNI